MYVTGLKKQAIAFETEGPKAPNVFGGKSAQLLITTLNTVLNTIVIPCEGVHIGAMYDVPADGFSWTDQDGLMTIVNATPAVSGGIIATPAQDFTVKNYVGAASWAAGVASLDIRVNLGQTFDFVVGQIITVSGVSNPGYDADSVTITAVVGTVISYALAADPGGDSFGGDVTRNGLPGTLIARAYNNDPAFATIFLPQG